MSAKVFFSSSVKFDVVVSDLIKREWLPASTYDSNVELSWMNLKTVCFDVVPCRQIINHLKGSQHLSNKSLFSYNLETFYPENSILPLNWSSAFQDLGELISSVLLNSIYCYIKNLFLNSVHNERLIDIFRSVLRRLRMESDIALVLNDVSSCVKLLDCFTFDRKFNIQQLHSVIQDLEKCQPWRVQWGGTRDLWIVKPVGLSCGEQIEVVSGIQAVIVSVEKLNYKCVVQKYIEMPMLVRSPLSIPNSRPTRKFDIRQWILVTALDPLVVYGFSECYLRLSSQEYSLTSQSLSDAKVHLCNYAIQKQTKNVDGDDQDDSNEPSDDTPCDTMLTQSAFELQLIELNLPQWQHSEHPFHDFVQPKIKMACLAAINSCRTRLKRVGRGFEWLGLDLMVVLDADHSLDASRVASVLLLEVNVSPDVSLSTPITARLVRPAVTDLFSLILDESALDWTPPLVRSCEVNHSDCPPRSAVKESNDTQPHWELWYNSDNSEDCANLQNAFGKKLKRSLTGSRGPGNVFRGLNGAVDHTPRKLELWRSVQECLRKGDDTVSGVDENDDEDEI